MIIKRIKKIEIKKKIEKDIKEVVHKLILRASQDLDQNTGIGIEKRKKDK